MSTKLPWKRLAIAGFVLALLILPVFLVVMVHFDSEALGQAVLERASRQLDLELTADRFDFHPFRGLEIEGLTVRGSLEAGELDGHIERLVLRHELWPLLSRRVVVRELRIDRPRFELVAESPSESPPPSSGSDQESVPGAGSGSEPEVASGGLQLEIHQVRLEGAELKLASTDPEVAPTEVHGLDLMLDEVVTVPGRAPGLAALRAQGNLTVEQAQLGGTEATQGHGRVTLDNGHLRLAEGHLTVDAGEVRTLDLDLDLTTEPFAYELVLGADPLRTGRLLAAETEGKEADEVDGREPAAAEGSGFGPGRLQLTARGRGSDLQGMDGDGTLALDGGTLPAAPIFVAIDALVDGAALVGSDYEPVDVVFDIRSGRVDIQPFRLVAGGMALDVRGTAEPDGAWDLWLSLAVPRRGIDVHEIPRELLDVLTDDDGRLHLPLRVSGTADSVRVVPDPNALAQATREGARQRLQRKIEGGLGRGLQRLFGGDDGEG